MTTLTLDATQLRKAWPHIKRAIPRKATPPILGALTLQRINDDLVRLTTHGPIMSLTTYLSGSADSDEPLYLWWDAVDTALTRTVGELTFETEPVEDEDTPDNVRITGGSRELTVPIPPHENLPADRWAQLHGADQAPIVTLTRPQAEAIKTYVLGAAATDDARPELAGIHITVKGGQATLAASDGYRMGLYELPTEHQGEDVEIISRSDPFQLWSAVPDCAMIFEPVTFSPENSDNPAYEIPVFFQAHGVNYLAVVREIHGRYPDLAQIVPDGQHMRATVHVSREAIEDLAYAARNNKDVVTLTQDAALATTQIQGKTPSTVAWKNGHITWEQMDGEPDAAYAFNGRFLRWAVAKDDKLPIMVNGRNQAALVRKRIGGADLSLVIMPMAIGGNS